MGIDVSTSGGALLISLLRLLHIVGGLVWVGAALLMTFYVEPTAARAGAAGSSFLRAIYRDTNLPRMIPLSAFITTVAGLLLYELLSYSDAIGSPMGLVLTVGAAFGLLAFLHGFFAVWRPAGRLARALHSGAADETQLAALEGKLRSNGRISLWLAIVSLILMAGARYIGPVLG